jgi:hypothetical protein
VQIQRRNNLSTAQKWFLALLLIAPLAVALMKVAGLPGSAFLSRHLSLARLPGEMQARVQYVLLVPFGALMVVFVRLMLGIRMLGPFRSILLAVAFQITGIGVGLVFSAVVVGVIVALRPMLRSIRLPYFGRVSVILSVVALILMLGMLLSVWLGYPWLRNVAYFPVVALCLAGEGFARTLTREGIRSALWRGAATVSLAALIAVIADTATFARALSVHPELLIAQAAGIVVISEYLNWRLLEGLNPKVVKPARVRRGPTRPASGDGGPGDRSPRP